jgi:hypothetical protein
MKQEFVHKSKGRAQTRTSTDRGAEPSFPGGQSELAFPGRPGPAQTEGQSPLS